MGDRATAVQFYNAGVSALQAVDNPTRLNHSYQMFASSVYADPTYGEGFYQCGNNASDLNLLHAAIACYRRALECENDPKQKSKTLCNLGWRLHGVGLTKEALRVTNDALAIDSKQVYAWINQSCILGMLDQATLSLAAAERAFELAPTDTTVEMALAFACLFDGQYARGLKHFEKRFEYKLKNFMSYPYPRWNGEDNKVIFLVADQGLGDTISYARFVEAAAKKASYLHVVIQPELMRLFQHSFTHLPNVNLLPMGCNFPQADFWTTFVSLPYALGLNDEEIRTARNIDVPIYGLPKNWKVPDRKLHIGISWRGSALNDINEYRSIPVTQFLDLYRVPGIQLYSLQVDGSKQQMHDAGCSPLIKDLSPYIRDVCDTISLMQELDLVITCESALGHISATAGKECWIPYSYLGRDYRLGLDGETKLWTPKHRMFRQGNDMQWQPVFTKIVSALQERIHAG